MRKKRQSLYLQLSSEYQKRDGLFLNYSGKKLEEKLKEQNKKIDDVKTKIEENINELKEAEEKDISSLNIEEEIDSGQPVSESEKVSSFFKSIVSNEKSVIKSEEIVIYNDNPDFLYEPSPEAKKRGYESGYFSDEMVDKKINSLLTGQISSYGGYMSVSVDLYLYPGGRKVGSVMEIGSIKDMELITSSIVRQLVPLLTNSMPVKINLSIKPEAALENVQIYIDDLLQKTSSYKLVTNSGVHTVQIVAEGYKSLATSYYFQGNTVYDIEVNLEEKKDGIINIELKNDLMGNIYTNGLLAHKEKQDEFKIKINGQQILGEFIAEDGKTSFFYIPEKLLNDGNYVRINPKPDDRSKTIDKRRKWMYGAYSAFMVSLIPTFITKGFLENNTQLYKDNYISYNEAMNWQTAYNVCASFSIGLAVFWGIELVRYLVSANSVLPEKAKQIKQEDLYLYENNIDKKINSEEIENNKKLEDEKEIEKGNNAVENKN